MTLPLRVKIGLFFFLWFEIQRCFDPGIDAAFFLTLLVAYGASIVSELGYEVAGLDEELSSIFIAWGIIWVVLYVWLAPRLIKGLPISLVICAVAALIMLGQWGFCEFRKRRELFSAQWLRDRSEAVLGVVYGSLGVAMLSERRYGSVLPAIGCAALFILPFAFGWRLAARAIRTPFDAVFGDRTTFRDSGVSEDQ